MDKEWGEVHRSYKRCSVWKASNVFPKEPEEDVTLER